VGGWVVEVVVVGEIGFVEIVAVGGGGGGGGGGGVVDIVEGVVDVEVVGV